MLKAVTWGLLIVATWAISLSIIAATRMAASRFGDGDILVGLAYVAFLSVQAVLVFAFWRSQISWTSSKSEHVNEHETSIGESA